jgi:hypothetical protein
MNTPMDPAIQQAMTTMQGRDEAAKRDAMVQALMRGAGPRSVDEFAASGPGSIMGGVANGVMGALPLLFSSRSAGGAQFSPLKALGVMPIQGGGVK